MTLDSSGAPAKVALTGGDGDVAPLAPPAQPPPEQQTQPPQPVPKLAVASGRMRCGGSRLPAWPGGYCTKGACRDVAPRVDLWSPALQASHRARWRMEVLLRDRLDGGSQKPLEFIARAFRRIPARALVRPNRSRIVNGGRRGGLLDADVVLGADVAFGGDGPRARIKGFVRAIDWPLDPSGTTVASCRFHPHPALAVSATNAILSHRAWLDCSLLLEGRGGAIAGATRRKSAAEPAPDVPEAAPRGTARALATLHLPAQGLAVTMDIGPFLNSAGRPRLSLSASVAFHGTRTVLPKSLRVSGAKKMGIGERGGGEKGRKAHIAVQSTLAAHPLRHELSAAVAEGAAVTPAPGARLPPALAPRPSIPSHATAPSVIPSSTPGGRGLGLEWLLFRGTKAGFSPRPEAAVVGGHWIDPGPDTGAPGERELNLAIADAVTRKLSRKGWVVWRPDRNAKEGSWQDYLDWVGRQTVRGVPVVEIHGQGKLPMTLRRSLPISFFSPFPSLPRLCFSLLARLHSITH